MARHETNFVEVSFAFLLGSLVGATIALLYAPTTGEQTRRRLRQAADEAQGDLKEQYGRLSDKAEIELSRFKDRVNDRVDRAKGYYDKQKSKVREAFIEGKRAAEQESSQEEIPASTSEQS